jgi:D-alanine transaminase
MGKTKDRTAMTIAFLNDEFVPLEEARISPMDRGFLFGDGIYEVIPSYGGKLIGLDLHLARLENGLNEIGIKTPRSRDQLRDIFVELMERNGKGNLGIYLQITRGVTMKRSHAFPGTAAPTLFAYTFNIPAPVSGEPDKVTHWKVTTRQDLRWQRCHIKSTSLLGNVLHMMEGVNDGGGEILLFDANNQLTEAAACNVFVVHNNEVKTPPLDQHKLAGVTREMALQILRTHSSINVLETQITKDEVLAADEVWLSSSTKELEPVVSIDGKPVGAGKPGPVWAQAQSLFHLHRFDHFK